MKFELISYQNVVPKNSIEISKVQINFINLH